MKEKQWIFIIVGIIAIILIGNQLGLFTAGYSYSGIFYNFNPDFSKNVSGAIIKSTSNIDGFSYSGYTGGEIPFNCNRQFYTFDTLPTNLDSSSFCGGHAIVSKINQVDYYNGNMGMNLNIQAKSTSKYVNSGKMGTMIITDKKYDFNKIKSISFDYEITESLTGSCWMSSSVQQGGSATTNIKIGLTNSKRNIIGVQDEVDFGCSPTIKQFSGSYILDSSIIDIPSDIPYEFFVYGNIDGGDYASGGVTSNLKIDITNIRIIEKSPSEIPSEANETIENEIPDTSGEIILEESFWDKIFFNIGDFKFTGLILTIVLGGLLILIISKK